MSALNPTLNFQVGNIAAIPLLQSELSAISSQLNSVARSIVAIARTDWNAYERSWDFQSLPLLTASSDPTPTLESSYTAWITQNRETIAAMKRLEEENNRLFIDAYGLQDELTPDVPIEQITLTVNPAYRYGGKLSEEEQWTRFRTDTMEELLSYGVGCMMGRYSLDKPGLILADSRSSQDDHLAAYTEKVGKPMTNSGSGPMTTPSSPCSMASGLKTTSWPAAGNSCGSAFPGSNPIDNLASWKSGSARTCANTSAPTSTSPTCRPTRTGRSTGWCRAPREGFACLIYLHRYTKDTLLLVLNNYFRPYLQKLEARLAQLGLDQLNDDLPTRERTAARKEAEKITKVLRECQEWEQDALLPLAQQRIELDLDDGVKVNYLKLQDVLAKIPGLKAKED